MFAICSNGMTFNAIFPLKWNFCDSVMNSTCLVTQPQTESRGNMRMKHFTAALTGSSANNDVFITSTALQTKTAFIWHTTRCDIRQYNDTHYVCNTCTIFIASQHCSSCISAFHQLEPRLNFSIKHAFFENHWQLGHSTAAPNVPGPPSTMEKEMLRLQGLWSGDMAVFA